MVVAKFYIDINLKLISFVVNSDKKILKNDFFNENFKKADFLFLYIKSKAEETFHHFSKFKETN